VSIFLYIIHAIAFLHMELYTPICITMFIKNIAQLNYLKKFSQTQAIYGAVI